MTNKSPRTRGAGVKPALVHINLRVPKEVAAFYRANAPDCFTGKMREVLTLHAIRNGATIIK
jgi:hypothetical protein